MADWFTPSSGNVFLDAGFRRAEAARLLLRSQLALVVERIFKRRQLTQRQAAELFGVSQPRVNDLLRGRIERFSVDGLVSMLAHAGFTVGATVSDARRRTTRRHIRTARKHQRSRRARAG